MITKQTILENLDQIKKYISEIESKEIKIDTKYWTITSENTKEWYLWLDDRMDYDRLNNHNVYLNEADCDKQIAKNEALNKIKTYIKDNFGEWTPIKEEDYKVYMDDHCLVVKIKEGIHLSKKMCLWIKNNFDKIDFEKNKLS